MEEVVTDVEGPDMSKENPVGGGVSGEVLGFALFFAPTALCLLEDGGGGSKSSFFIALPIIQAL